MLRAASVGGLLPEQVWDAAAIPEQGLFPGRPSGGAMPLVWAHAEFLKLLVARERGRPVEWLDCVAQHFGTAARGDLQANQSAAASAAASVAAVWHWRAEAPVLRLPRGKSVAIEDRRPFALHVGFDGWQRVEDRHAEPNPFGLWSVLLAHQELVESREINFTRSYAEGWEQLDRLIELEPSRRSG
jgi:glucoamylase